MIKPQCGRCGEELQDYGAIIISPPINIVVVEKIHICLDCYELLLEWTGNKLKKEI